MEEKEFQARLSKLMEQIQTLPDEERTKLEDLAAQTQSRHVRLRKTVADLTESLDYLRLSIKYLVFDLEATRRENSYLRNMLQDQPGHESVDPPQAGDHDDDDDMNFPGKGA